MSDQSDIDNALHSGKQAAESLLTWQKGSEAHRQVRDRIWTIERGIEAMDRLSRNLREGRMHIVAPYDDAAHDTPPHAVNRDTAGAGYELCGDCHGEGTQMEMKCYGGEPSESTTHCDTCSGEGQVEINTPEGEAARAAAEAATVAAALPPVAPVPAPTPEPKSLDQMLDAYDDLVRQGLTVEARMAMKDWATVTYAGDASVSTPQ
jgi:hypothetical protein